MAKDGWNWGNIGPDLSKLPPHLRENLTEPIPLRPGEVRGRVFIFRNTPGLNHPNGRVLVAPYHKDVAQPSTTPDGAQIDVADYTGRLPLATVVLAKKHMPDVMKGLVRNFLAMGGTREELLEMINESALPPRLPNPIFDGNTDE